MGMGLKIGLTIGRTTKVGSTFTPASLFPANGGWWDSSDTATLFQVSNGTGAVVANDPVGYWGDKSGNGNHLVEATAANRAIYKAGPYLDFDGVNDGLARSITYSAASDVFVVMRNVADTAYVILLSDASHYLGNSQSGNGGGTTANAGTTSVLVNGSAITDTADALFTAIGTTATKLVETQTTALNSFTNTLLCNYPAGEAAIRLMEVLIVPAQSAGVRTQIRSYLTTKWGVA